MRNLLIASTLGAVLTILGWWAWRELRLEYMQEKHSSKLVLGMKRQVIENRLLSEGIRFFPESDDLDFVSVGYDVHQSLICAPREVGLLLEFEARDLTPSGDDVLRSVKRVRQERGCL